MTLKYFNVKNGLSTGNIFLHSGNSNIVANTFIGNLSVTGLANLGNVEHIRIGGGTNGQVLTTDGSGNLAWATSTGGGNVSLQLPDVSVDTFTADGSNNSFTLTDTPTNKDYVFVNVDGVFQFRDSYSLSGNVLSFGSTPLQDSLIEISVMVPGVSSGGGSGASANTIYNGNSNVKVYANSDVTISSNGTANVVSISSSDITISANIIPSANVTYDLGNATHSFRDLYLSGNTLYFGGATIKSDGTTGAIAIIPAPSVSTPNPTGIVITTVGTITTVATSNGDVTTGAISNAVANTSSIGYASMTYVDSAIANLVNSAPATLDTLKELATSLGNDASFSTTVTNTLANKLNSNAFTYANIGGNLTIDPGNIHITGGSNGYILQTDGAGNLQWVDNLPSTVAYTANSISLTGGVYVSGSVSSIQTFGDYASGNVYVLTDGTGTAPAWQVDIDFTSVTDFNRVVLNINYTQASGHTVYIQLYNYTTSAWDSIGTYTGLGSYYAFALQVISATPYINGSGRVQLKVYHSNSGNSAHQTSIDYVGLELSSQGPQGPKGATGATGAAGNGVATGGTAGQILIKNSSTNYDTTWTSDLTSLGNVTLTGNLTSANANLGNLVTANYFTGNGSSLSSITGANVTGFVPNANVANTAFAVAVANVTGIGNIATVNKDGNASNILYGNGVFASAPVTYGNSNVATYLPTYTGNLSPGNLSIASANLKITGGTIGQVLSTDGTGNLSWAAAGGATPQAAYSRTSFTATANQTSFSVTYTAGFIQVFINGVMLASGDYTASNGTSVVLSVGATAGDIVEVISFLFTTPAFTVGTPILNGPTSSNEGTTTTFNISNYNASYAYVVAVTGGSYTRSGATVIWTLPLVSSDTVHTLNVQAVYSGSSSTFGSASITVVDLPLPGDTGLYITDFTSFATNDGWVF